MKQSKQYLPISDKIHLFFLSFCLSLSLFSDLSLPLSQIWSPFCRQHKDEVSGDIFDMLLTFTDFMAFKEMFIDYRAVSRKLTMTQDKDFDVIYQSVPARFNHEEVCHDIYDPWSICFSNQY